MVYYAVLGAVILGAALLSIGQKEYAIWLLSAVGLFHTLFNKPREFCAKWSGCEAVLASPYARPLGIPLEYLGAMWFAVVPLAYYLGLGPLWAALGIAGIAALVAIEAKLKALCIYCTVAHIAGLLISIALLS